MASRIIFALLVIVIYGELQSAAGSVGIQEKTVYEDDAVTFSCGITNNKNIKKIGWSWNDSKLPVVTVDLKDVEKNIEVRDQHFSGRLSINTAGNGDLTLKSVKWEDAGKYHCFYLDDQGAAVERNTSLLKVNVIPNKLDVQCFSDEEQSSEVPCFDSKSDIHTIICSVTSFPKSTLNRLKSPNCDKEFVDTRHCNVVEEDPVTCFMQLENVCMGSYVCGATFDDGERQKTVQSKSIEISKAKELPEPKTWIIVIAIVVPLFILIIIIILIVVCCRKHPKFCMKNAPINMENGIDRQSSPSENVPLKSKPNVEFPADASKNESDIVDNERNEYIKSRQLMLQDAYASGEQAIQNTDDLQSIEMILRTKGGTKFTLGVDKTKPQLKPQDSFESLGENKAIENVQVDA